MREIVPGLWHWTAKHGGIDREVSSYLVGGGGGGVVLNPMLGDGGLEALRERGGVSAVVLTNRHHIRDSDAVVEAFGASLHVPATGAAEVAAGGREVVAYEPGDELPGAMRAVEVGVLSPDETALHLPEQAAIAFADGIMREGRGALGFFGDGLLGDDPKGVKLGLLDAFERLVRLGPDHLLLAHGDPVIGVGRRALQRFVAENRITLAL